MLHLKFKSENYGRVLFSSDFHYNHNKPFLYEPRGFSSWQDHAEFIRKQILSLRHDDLLFCLGDMFLNCSPEEAERILNLFPCETYVLWGNHPAGVKQAYQKAYAASGFPVGGEFYPLKITPNVTHLGDNFLLDIDNDNFFCTHMAPLIWEGCGKTDSRQRSCLCGHSHANLKPANPGEDGFGKILDVGVDNAIKYNGTAFLSKREVVSILRSKKNKTWDHH